MKRRNEFVSVELILSGRGFRAVHEFLDSAVRHPSFDGPDDDAAPEITHLGLEGQCPVCVQTLDLWTAMYGAEAGKLAFKVIARGGFLVPGGTAINNRNEIEDSAI